MLSGGHALYSPSEKQRNYVFLSQSLKAKYLCTAGKNQGLPSYSGRLDGGGRKKELGRLPVPIAVSATFFPNQRAQTVPEPA